MNHAADSEPHVGSNVAAAAREAWRLNLTNPGQGVISARHSEDGVILITAAEVSFADITFEDICLVNLAGDVIAAANGHHPPAELECYLKVFQDRSDVNALAHLYPPNACGYAAQSQLFPISNRKAQLEVGELIRVLCRECPSRFTGLCSCWTDIRQSTAGAGALLLKENGIITLAADLDSALHKAELLEQAAGEAPL